MGKIKVGIIGTGSISTVHIEGYLANENVELYALCDLNEKLLNEAAKKYNVSRTFTDYNEMLKLKEIDAVSVCTWNSEHAACSIAALNAGKHVLCEKPMAISKEQAIKMKEAADKNEKLLMVGFVRRFGIDYDVLKEFIDNGDMGEIYCVKATYLRRNGNPGGWFGNKALSGGGPLIDLGVHVIDLARFIMGNPKPVSVYGVTFQKLFDRPALKDVKNYVSANKREDDICDVEDLALALIRFDNGSVISVETSFSLNIKDNVGNLEIFNDTNGYLTNLSFDSKTALSFGEHFNHEINHFVDCILNGKECISPAEDGVEIMGILDAIYESAKIGHEVIL